MLNNFSQKLFLSMLAIGLIPLLVVSAIMFNMQIEDTRDSVNSLLITDALDGSQKNFLLIQDIETNIDNIVNRDNFILALRQLIINNTLDNFSASLVLGSEINPLYEINGVFEILILHPTSFDTLYSSEFDSDIFKINPDLLQLARTETVVSDAFLIESHSFLDSDETSFYGFYILTPVYSETGLEGILSVGVNKSILTSIPSDSDFSSIDHYLINYDGVMISKPKFDLRMIEMELFENNPELELKQIIPDSNSNTKIHEMINMKNFDQIESYTNFLGKKTLGVISPIDQTPWFYVVEIQEEEAFSELTELTIIIISLIIIVSLGILEIALLFSMSLSSPINNLVIATKKIIEGDLSAKIRHSNIDEINDLSNSFEEMQHHLNESSTRIQNELHAKNELAQTLRIANDDLKSSEEKFRDLYENSPNLLRTINDKGIIVDCNNVYAKKLGYTKNEIIGSSIFEYVPKEDFVLMKESFETWKKFGRVGGKQVVMQRKNGEKFPALITAAGIYDEQGNLIGSNTSITDLSDIHEAKKIIEEEKLKRLTAIGELSSRIAHDLRNPMSVLKNTIELIQHDLGEDQDEKMKGKFDRISRAITRINHQVENVLDFVREKPLKLESSTVNTILNYVIDKINIPETIRITLPKDDIKILCDFEKIEIVFINLITNAIQAMANKGEIDIRCKYIDDNLVIEIEDNGPGISDENLQKIFDPLFTTRQVGTGLGLPSCKTIVEAHKGKIEVSSILGKGTIFRIEMPKN